jgi:hypothetical protein
MFFSNQTLENFDTPAADPNWKFPLRQTSALPDCLYRQNPWKQFKALGSEFSVSAIRRKEP